MLTKIISHGDRKPAQHYTSVHRFPQDTTPSRCDLCLYLCPVPQHHCIDRFVRSVHFQNPSLQEEHASYARAVGNLPFFSRKPGRYIAPGMTDIDIGVCQRLERKMWLVAMFSVALPPGGDGKFDRLDYVL